MNKLYQMDEYVYVEFFCLVSLVNNASFAGCLRYFQSCLDVFRDLIFFAGHPRNVVNFDYGHVSKLDTRHGRVFML